MTRAFKCDSCGDLFEGESPAVARLNVRAGEEFGVPDHLRVEGETSVSDRVRRLAGDGGEGEDLYMELCLGCARDLIPEPESGSVSEGPEAATTGVE